MGYPSKQDISEAEKSRPTLTTYEDAIGYVEATRSGMTRYRNIVDWSENVSSATVIVGSVIGLTSSIFRSKASSDTGRIGLLSAGTAFGIGTILNPRQQIQVVDNGIAALDCLKEKSRATYRALAPISDLLDPLNSALGELKTAIDAGADVDPNVMAQARASYSRALVEKAAKAPSIVALVDKIVDGTDQIITQTNIELKHAEPDVNAIQRIAAGINLVKLSGSPSTKPAAPTSPGTIAPSGGAAASVPAAATRGQVETAAIDKAMADVERELPILDAIAGVRAPPSDALASCKAAVVTEGTMVLSPASDATPTSKTPWSISASVVGFGSWEGATPSDITASPLNVPAKAFTFTTTSSAAGSQAYRFVVRSVVDDSNSAAINVKVGATN